MNKRCVRDIDIKGKRVLVRVDLNVPRDDKTGAITDESRIRATLPTIRYLIDRQSKVVLCSHMGRPNGKVEPINSLAPLAERLSTMLGVKVAMARDCVGEAVIQQVGAMKQGEVVLLENVRFHPEEEANEPDFAKALANLADVFLNDAFGVAHRAHASTEGITHYLPSVAGFLMEKEIDILGKIIDSPERPVAAVSGGAKVSDKLLLLQKMLDTVDVMILGGAMCGTFFKSRGYEVGDSLIESELLGATTEIERGALDRGVKFLLPEDVVIGQSFDADADAKIVAATAIEPGWMVLDIGPLAANTFAKALTACKTVIWNGPMGVCEMPRFAKGTHKLAEVIASLAATTVAGGGSTAQVLQDLGLVNDMTHVSTGGGASLDLLEGKTLPGLAALLDK